jgi:uncharacterized protein (UPF0333 family)
MAFKNSLITNKGQSILEYFILLAVIVSVALITVSNSFYSSVKATEEGLFDNIAGRIINAD